MISRSQYFKRLLELFEKHIEENDPIREYEIEVEILDFIDIYDGKKNLDATIGLLKTLQIIDEALKAGLTIEANDPIHQQVIRILKT